MPEVGIEPTRGCPRGILNPVRLPISPLRHSWFSLLLQGFNGDTLEINLETFVPDYTQIWICVKVLVAFTPFPIDQGTGN